ncbi:MAG: hypothetical protein CVU96_02100 [Firmicutes bacterium HGW-Firmicutes-20]|jgi:hypothetical protein|nr:MAG: hypothetical protein CVU96_02100 [Firmicutes bacterium HGW-Firmicutes-20]
MKNTKFLCYLIVGLTFTSALVGIFYSTGAERFIVENIYGENIELFGDGIYRYNSLIKAAGNKGTDIVMFIVASAFGWLTYFREKSNRFKFWHVGALAGLLYYSACLVFGVTFNSLFPVYVGLFSVSLFMMIYVIDDLIHSDNLVDSITDFKFSTTAFFLLLCGLSVLVWLEFILPAVLSGKPLSMIEIYTTEPTFVLDLAIILPVYLISAFALYKRKIIGYKLTPILLTFITIVGLTVISQNIIQTAVGVDIPIKDLVVLVFSFVLLGVVATILNFKFIKFIKT